MKKHIKALLTVILSVIGINMSFAQFVDMGICDSEGNKIMWAESDLKLDTKGNYTLHHPYAVGEQFSKEDIPTAISVFGKFCKVPSTDDYARLLANCEASYHPNRVKKTLDLSNLNSATL